MQLAQEQSQHQAMQVAMELEAHEKECATARQLGQTHVAA
jgi:hypothetical protein